MIDFKYLRRISELYSYLQKYDELPKPKEKRVNFTDGKSMNAWLRSENCKYILTELATLDNRKAKAILDYMTLSLIAKEEEPEIEYEDKLREAASYNQVKSINTERKCHIFEDGTSIEKWIKENYDKIKLQADKGNKDAQKIIKERNQDGSVRKEVIMIPIKLKEEYQVFSRNDLPNLLEVYKSIISDGYLSDKSFPYQSFRLKFLTVNYANPELTKSSDIIKNLLSIGIENYIADYNDFDEMIKLILNNLTRSTKMILGTKFYNYKKVNADVQKDLNWINKNKERILNNTKYSVNANKLIKEYLLNKDIYLNYLPVQIFEPKEEPEAKKEEYKKFEEALIQRYLNSIEKTSLVKEPKTLVVIIPDVPDEKHLTKQI